MLKFLAFLIVFSSCSFSQYNLAGSLSQKSELKNKEVEIKKLLKLKTSNQINIFKRLLVLASEYENIKAYEEAYSIYEFVLGKNTAIFERESAYLEKINNILEYFYANKGYNRAELAERYLFLTDLFPNIKYTPLWLLKLGNLYFEEREFIDAQVHYERIIKYYSNTPQATDAHFKLINLFLTLSEENKERGDFLFKARVQYLLLQKILPSRKKFENELISLEKKLINQQADYLLYLAKFYEKKIPLYSIEKLNQLMRSYPSAKNIEKAKKLHSKLKKLL